jgi:hypothetical protein
MPITVTLTGKAEEVTLGPFENIDQAADAALARPDIDSNHIQATRSAWEPPDLSHLGQHNDKYQEGV